MRNQQDEIQLLGPLNWLLSIHKDNLGKIVSQLVIECTKMVLMHCTTDQATVQLARNSPAGQPKKHSCLLNVISHQ